MTQLTGYADFESILIKTAEQEGWEFQDGDDRVGAEVVFNQQTYGPLILRIAEDELADRGLTEDLGLVYAANSEAMAGVEVAFREESKGRVEAYTQMIWRLALSISVLKSLPRNGNVFDLSVLYAARFDELRRLEND